MRRINYYVACSVDGFIADKNGEPRAFSGRDTHPFDFVATLAAFDVLLMGRKTYDYSRREGHETDPNKANYVFSRTMTISPDPNVTIISAHMIDFVRGIKHDAGKDIWLVGGAEVASQLFAAHLINDITLKVNPVVFGSGLHLFTDVINETELELVNSTVYPSSYLVNHYRVVG